MPVKICAYFVLLCSAILLNNLVKPAYAYQPPDESAVETLKAIFAKSDAQIDLAFTKLTIDRLVDPNVDIGRALGEINYMVEMVNSAAMPDMTAIDRMQSLRTYLYDSGYWNQNRPFQYDFADPYGTNIQNKLLPTYLNTRKGNCISMPFLFVILADKLGLEVTIATAPVHVFVKFKDPQSGKWFNLETTHIAEIVDDGFYRKKSPMSAKAIASGVYLQPLRKKEMVAVMTMVLAEHYAGQQRWQESIAVAELALQYYPNYAYAMLKVGNAYRGLLQAKIKQYKGQTEIPLAEKSRMDELYAQNRLWFEKAEAIGWQPVTAANNAEYLKSIKRHAGK